MFSAEHHTGIILVGALLVSTLEHYTGIYDSSTDKFYKA
jgi:hypothetical protein